jgi:hypothetical protein
VLEKMDEARHCIKSGHVSEKHLRKKIKTEPDAENVQVKNHETGQNASELTFKSESLAVTNNNNNNNNIFHIVQVENGTEMEFRKTDYASLTASPALGFKNQSPDSAFRTEPVSHSSLYLGPGRTDSDDFVTTELKAVVKVEPSDEGVNTGREQGENMINLINMEGKFPVCAGEALHKYRPRWTTDSCDYVQMSDNQLQDFKEELCGFIGTCGTEPTDMLGKQPECQTEESFQGRCEDKERAVSSFGMDMNGFLPGGHVGKIDGRKMELNMENGPFVKLQSSIEETLESTVSIRPV